MAGKNPKSKEIFLESDNNVVKDSEAIKTMEESIILSVESIGNDILGEQSNEVTEAEVGRKFLIEDHTFDEEWLTVFNKKKILLKK